MECFIQKAKSHVKNNLNDILLIQFQTKYIDNLNNLTLRNLLQNKFKNYSSRSISAKTPRIKLIAGEKDEPPVILVEIKDGEKEEILPYKWKIFNFELS